MRSGVAGAVLAVFGACLLATPAAATETCTFDAAADELRINTTQAGDRTRVYVTSGVIHVDEVIEGQGAFPLTCAGGAATQTTIDTILVRDTSAGATTVGVLDPREFGPGVSDEPLSADEIEWDVSMGPGRDTVGLSDNSNGLDDAWRFGADGINLDPAMFFNDVEYDLTGVDKVEVLGGEGVDELSGRGDAVTGAPFAAKLYLFGGDDGDTLVGGDGRNKLVGYNGNDLIKGGPRRDRIDGQSGDDDLRGRDGNDRIIGGLNADELLGNDGVDRLFAAEPIAFADLTINCGAGDNDRESAERDDQDPPAVSC